MEGHAAPWTRLDGGGNQLVYGGCNGRRRWAHAPRKWYYWSKKGMDHGTLGETSSVSRRSRHPRPDDISASISDHDRPGLQAIPLAFCYRNRPCCFPRGSMSMSRLCRTGWPETRFVSSSRQAAEVWVSLAPASANHAFHVHCNNRIEALSLY